MRLFIGAEIIERTQGGGFLGGIEDDHMLLLYLGFDARNEQYPFPMGIGDNIHVEREKLVLGDGEDLEPQGGRMVDQTLGRMSDRILRTVARVEMKISLQLFSQNRILLRLWKMN